MMTWMMARLRATYTCETRASTARPLTITREELVELFADDLARPVLQKRSGARRKSSRHLMAGRQFRFA